MAPEVVVIGDGGGGLGWDGRGRRKPKGREFFLCVFCVLSWDGGGICVCFVYFEVCR